MMNFDEMPEFSKELKQLGKKYMTERRSARQNNEKLTS